MKKCNKRRRTRLNRHICHLWRKDGCADYLAWGTGACDPLGGFLSEPERPRSGPRRAFKLALAAGVRLIGGIQMAAV